MIKNILFFRLLLVVAGNGLFACENVIALPFLQNTLIRIGSIEVQGNHKTKQDVITRELEFKSGDWVDSLQLEKARERIENLKIFNRVQFHLQDAGAASDLLILVWERWYLFPSLIFRINEHDWHKISYGLGIYHLNFRGRTETLWFSGWLGYDPGFDFSYSNRWFGGNRRFYSTFQLLSQRVKTKSLHYPNQKENHRGAAWLIGKRFGLHWYSDANFDLSFISAEDHRLLWQSNHSQDQVFSINLRLHLDTRDLWEYPQSGSLGSVAFLHSELLNGNAGLNHWLLDWREYRTYWGVTLAGRFASDLTQNPLPVYQYLYLGYEERIRGHFQDIFEGENRTLGSFEIRVPLIKEWYFQVPMESWYAAYFQNMKFGLYLTVFHDAGAVWHQHEKLTRRDLQSGSGIGLNLILPYSNILRLEFAVDERGKTEEIVDVNIAF